MTVNHFGPYTIDEELQMRVDTLNNEIRHHGEKIIEAQKDIASRKTEQRRLEGLRDEYQRIIHPAQGKSAGTITATLKLDTTEFDRDLARAKERSHN